MPKKGKNVLGKKLESMGFKRSRGNKTERKGREIKEKEKELSFKITYETKVGSETRKI